MATGDYRPASLAAEGFVHFSYAHQVAVVANARYAAQANLCVVEIDPARVPAEVRVEDSYGSGTAYPHVYGPIPTMAAVAVHDLPRGPDGRYQFDGDDLRTGGAGAAASPGR
jgi:uncharacterized protein (DUF952 family)